MPNELKSLEVPQWFIESSYGTNGTATRIFGNIESSGFDLKPDQKKESHGIAGIGVETDENLTNEMSKGSCKLWFDYEEIGYQHCSNFGAPATTNPVASVYQHVFEWNPLGAFTPQSYTVEAADAAGGRAYKANGLVFNGMKITTDPEKQATVDSAMLAKKLQEGITPSVGQNDVQTATINGGPAGGTFKLIYDGLATAAIAFNAVASAVQTAIQALGGDVATATVAGSAGGPYTITTPTGKMVQTFSADATALTGGTSPSVTVVHTTPGGMKLNSAPRVLPGEISVAFASSLAGLDSAPTTLLNEYSTGIEIAERLDAIWRQNVADTGPGGIQIKKADQIKDMISLCMAYDSQAATFVANSQSGTRMYVRLKFTSAQTIASSGVNYSHQLDMSGIVTWKDVAKDSQNNLKSVDLDLRALYDVATRFYMRWIMINGKASYVAN